LQEEVRERLADDVRAADDYGVPACDLHAGVLDQAHAGERGAWHHARPAGHERTEVGFMKAVDVLGRRDGFEHARGVDPLRERELHQDAVHRRVGVQRRDRLHQLGF
jgi:hypothetical protein